MLIYPRQVSLIDADYILIFTHDSLSLVTHKSHNHNNNHNIRTQEFTRLPVGEGAPRAVQQQRLGHLRRAEQTRGLQAGVPAGLQARRESGVCEQYNGNKV